MELLRKYYAIVRAELAIFRGREIGTAGDGFLATFEVPAQAIRCASAVRGGMGSLGFQIKAGLHAGEYESLDKSIAGIAVHIGFRVLAIAGPGEVLVSSTVKELVMGSGIGFVEHGAHSLKGVPGEWRLFLALDDGVALQNPSRRSSSARRHASWNNQHLLEMNNMHSFHYTRVHSELRRRMTRTFCEGVSFCSQCRVRLAPLQRHLLNSPFEMANTSQELLDLFEERALLADLRTDVVRCSTNTLPLHSSKQLPRAVKDESGHLQSVPGLC